MKVHKKFAVYEMAGIMGSEQKSIIPVYFDEGGQFDTEEDAIQAMIKAGKTYDKYLILTTVYINN